MLETSLYYDWLTSMIDDGKDSIGKYSKMLHDLHETEFYWLNQSDYNRSIDGLALRKKFEMEHPNGTDAVPGWLEGRCSVLEMLIAVSSRIENEYLGDFKDGDKTYAWFWEMMKNLGLDKLPNKVFTEDKFQDIMGRFLAKTPNTKKKTRALKLFWDEKDYIHDPEYPIWDQMMMWINEKIGPQNLEV